MRRRESLRLGASTTVAQYVLPRILGAFLRQYPQVRLSLISGNTEQIAEAVAEEQVELGIIEGPAMRRDVKTERMVQDEMVLIVSPKHAWARGRRGGFAAAELAKVPLLLRERGSGSRRVVERALKKAGIAAAVAEGGDGAGFDGGDYLGCGGGAGGGVCSRWAVDKVLRLGSVRIVAVEGLEIVRDFSFVRLAGAELTGRRRRFSGLRWDAVAS